MKSLTVVEGGDGPSGNREVEFPGRLQQTLFDEESQWNVRMTALAALLQILGTFMVAREVWLSIATEKALGGLGQVEDLVLLYAREDYRGFWISSQVTNGVDIATARKMADGLGEDAIQRAIETQYPLDAALRSIHRAEQKTKPAVFRRRQAFLITGASLLILGTALPTLASWLGAS